MADLVNSCKNPCNRSSEGTGRTIFVVDRNKDPTRAYVWKPSYIQHLHT